MNDIIEEKEVNVLKNASMSYPTWNVIKKLLDNDKFNDPEKSFGDKPIEKGNDPIYSKIKGDIIKEYQVSTPCGIDIPVLLKPTPNTSSDNPLILILGESALRNKEELAGIEKANANVILGTPYAIHLKECPPKCGVYRKVFDAILKKGYSIYITDIIKIWWEEKKGNLLVPNDKDIEVFRNELDILRNEINKNIIIVAWGKKAQNGLEEVRKSQEVVPPSLSLPHPGQRNWDAWKLRIFEKAVYDEGITYAKKRYPEKKSATNEEIVANEVVEEIISFVEQHKK